MALVLQLAGYAAAICLQVLIIVAMRKGAWRTYPFCFVYVIADLITNILEIQPNLAHEQGTREAQRYWALVYWTDERIIQFLLFVLVISLIYRASTHVRPRRTLMFILICGSIAFSAGSLFLHHSPNIVLGRWMTRWTRDMNAAAAVLDLALWAMLIRAREKDFRVLLISGGLGLQFTAGAVGQALRDISHATVDISSILIVTANLTCLYIWWQAFRTPVRVQARRPVVLQSAKKLGQTPEGAGPKDAAEVRDR